MGYPANACDLLLEPSGDRAEFINKNSILDKWIIDIIIKVTLMVIFIIGR